MQGYVFYKMITELLQLMLRGIVELKMTNGYTIVNFQYQKNINQTQLHFTRNHFVKTLDDCTLAKVGKNHLENVTTILVIINLMQLLDIILHHLMIAMF